MANIQTIKDKYPENFEELSDDALQNLWNDFCIEMWGKKSLPIQNLDIKPFVLWATSSPLDWAKRGQNNVQD